jgi:hypothetical protein
MFLPLFIYLVICLSMNSLGSQFSSETHHIGKYFSEKGLLNIAWHIHSLFNFPDTGGIGNTLHMSLNIITRV